jgi:hypothetical protein
MSQHYLGHPVDACAEFDRAVRWQESWTGIEPEVDLEFQALRAEAEAVLAERGR